MRPIIGAGCLAALVSIPLLCGPASAKDFAAGHLTIKTPWVRATPGGAKVAGGYLTVVNDGTTADRLTGASLDAAEKGELHEMSMQGGVMKMRATGPLDIPAGGSVTLAPAGKHIMFTGLKHGLKKGETVAGTLVFDHAGSVPVTFEIEGIGAKGPGESAGHGSSMPGMDMK